MKYTHERAASGSVIQGRAGYLARRLITIHDRERTGHGAADPLATASCLLLLMEHHTNEAEVRELVCRTLDMALSERRAAGGAFSWENGEIRADSNGLMIAALARAAVRWQQPKYQQAAEIARIFLKTRLTATDGGLFHRWQEGRGEGRGEVMDYACYILGLLELYESDYAVSCLREAQELGDCLVKRLNSVGGSVRGRGAAALALLRLKILTGRELVPEGSGPILPESGEEGNFVDRAMTWLAASEALFPHQLLVWSGRGEIPDWLPRFGEERSIPILAQTHDNARGLANAAPITARCRVPEAGESFSLFREGVMTLVNSREELEELL